MSPSFLQTQADSALFHQVLKEFFRLCAEVGPTRCALAPSSTLNLSEAEGTAHVQLAVFGLIKSLWEEPMQVLHSEGGPTLLTATDLHLQVKCHHRVMVNQFSRAKAYHRLRSRQIFWALYKPAGWAPLAAAIAEGIKGNGTALANLAGADPAFENPKKGRRSGDDNPFHRDAVSLISPHQVDLENSTQARSTGNNRRTIRYPLLGRGARDRLRKRLDRVR